jgi:hypothetical protein
MSDVTVPTLETNETATSHQKGARCEWRSVPNRQTEWIR